MDGSGAETRGDLTDLSHTHTLKIEPSITSRLETKFVAISMKGFNGIRSIGYIRFISIVGESSREQYSLSNRLRFFPPFCPLVEGRKHEKHKQCRCHQTPDDHRSQRPLHFCANSRRDGQRDSVCLKCPAQIWATMIHSLFERGRTPRLRWCWLGCSFGFFYRRNIKDKVLTRLHPVSTSDFTSDLTRAFSNFSNCSVLR